MTSSNLFPLSASASAVESTLPAKSGFDALGYVGVDNYVWSHPRQCVVALTANALSSAATLMAVCGEKWCEENFPKKNKEKKTVGFLVQKLAGNIITKCAEAGVYNPATIRGAGVWDSKSGLVINGAKIWSPNGMPITRSGFEGHIYPISRDIGIKEGGAIASPADLAEWEALLDSYTWGHKADTITISGWLTIAVLAGALARRPHVCITGPLGNGKTSLMLIIAKIIGGMGVNGDAQSTPAGIRQKLGAGAGSVILDEAENNSEKGSNISRLIAMARTTYSDDSADGILKGTSSGESRSFSMRLSFLLAAISPPAFEAADATRWVIAEVKSLKPEAALTPSRLVTDHSRASRLGDRIKALIVNRYDVFVKALAVFRTTMLNANAKARQADTVGYLVAGWWILHHDVAPSQAQADAIVASLDNVTHTEAHSASDEENCLSAILRGLLREGQETLTVAEAIDKVNEEGSKSRWVAVLGRAGLKVSGARLQIATSDDHSGVKGLLRGTKFEGGGWSRILKRLPYAENNKSSHIASMTQKVVSVIYPTRENVGAGEVVELFEGTVRKIG